MKTKAYVIVCLLLISVSFLFSIGIKVGINKSDILVENHSNFKPRECYSYGIYLQNQISNSIIFQPEFLINSKGAILDLSSMNKSNDQIEICLTYAEFPLLFKKKIGNNKENLQLYAGPSIAFLLSASAYTKPNNPNDFGSLKNEIKPFDTCLNIGGDLCLDNIYMLGIRYNRGLISLSSDSSILPKIANSSNLNISFGIMIK
jgi:hypothetical protein